MSAKILIWFRQVLVSIIIYPKNFIVRLRSYENPVCLATLWRSAVLHTPRGLTSHKSPDLRLGETRSLRFREGRDRLVSSIDAGPRPALPMMICHSEPGEPRLTRNAKSIIPRMYFRGTALYRRLKLLGLVAVGVRLPCRAAAPVLRRAATNPPRCCAHWQVQDGR